MREIKYKSISAGPGGVKHPGEVHLMPKNEAAALVKGGYAEYTTIEPPEKAIVIPAEKAVVVPEETAAIKQPEAPGKKARPIAKGKVKR